MLSLNRRLLPLLLTWTILLFMVHRVVGRISYVLDWRMFLFVALFPWLVALVAFPLRELSSTLTDCVRLNSEALPHGRRILSAHVLRTIGGLSFGTGLIAFFGTYLSVLKDLAAQTGNPGPSHFLTGLGVMLLAPVYGLALRAFFYEPLAQGFITGTFEAGSLENGESELSSTRKS